MMDRVTHEQIERAFQEPGGILDRLPDCHQREVAKAHLGQAQRIAHGLQEHQPREAAPETTGADMQISNERVAKSLLKPEYGKDRGPSMTGWPWRWTDGTAP